MTGYNANGEHLAERTAPLKRPRVRITSLTFSDGSVLTVGADEITILVGPNNSGKSVALNDVYQKLYTALHGGRTKVVSEAAFAFEGDAFSFNGWVVGLSMVSPNNDLRVPLCGTVGRDTPHNLWGQKEHVGLQNLIPLFAVHLNTETRLQSAKPVQNIDFYSQAPSHPFHIMYANDDVELKLEAIFKRAFGQDLVLNRSAGVSLGLHIGKRPALEEGQDRLSAQYVGAIHKMPLLHEQGDGMRAFLAILINVIAADRDIVLIDEPEAFLHPPQAYALGKFLAQEVPSGRQLLLATHSTDILRGLLDGGSQRVRVVRLERRQDVNHVTELSPERLREVWADPLLRFSKVLDGLFHDGVVVCEGDADCRFYAAMVDIVRDKGSARDLAFVYSAGKSRSSLIVKALRAVAVPVRVVLDFDALSDQAFLKQLCEALGGDWTNFNRDYTIVEAAIRQRRSQIPTSEAKRDLLNLFERVKSETLSDRDITAMRDVLKKASPWSEAKRMGKNFIPRGDAFAAYERLSKGFRSVGLFLVEVGELEGFCRTVPDHGPAWVIKTLEKDLKGDPELQEARQFAKKLASNWDVQSAELAAEENTIS